MTRKLTPTTGHVLTPNEELVATAAYAEGYLSGLRYAGHFSHAQDHIIAAGVIWETFAHDTTARDELMRSIAHSVTAMQARASRYPTRQEGA